VIEANSASLFYEDHGKIVRACDEISISISEGEFVGILGPSGSGKSSLLYLLTGLKVASQGAVFYNGRDFGSLTEFEKSAVRSSDFGFVFQQPYLLGYLTAIENVLLGSVDSSSHLGEALDLLDHLGLGDKAHRFPSELSGGEKQRVCVARALLGSPKFVFADEPTASLDHENGLQVVALLNSCRRGGLVLVTHDPLMLKNADRILYMEDGHLSEDRSLFLLDSESAGNIES
jgi:putative ABC transport system ATP-binding protein